MGMLTVTQGYLLILLAFLSPSLVAPAISSKSFLLLLGGTMQVDGRSDENMAFRAEALGCLSIPLIVCLAKEFINHHQRIGVHHRCDNQGLVDQLCQFYKHEHYHTFPDTAEMI